jgi:hypothetical protein
MDLQTHTSVRLKNRTPTWSIICYIHNVHIVKPALAWWAPPQGVDFMFVGSGPLCVCAGPCGLAACARLRVLAFVLVCGFVLRRVRCHVAWRCLPLALCVGRAFGRSAFALAASSGLVALWVLGGSARASFVSQRSLTCVVGALSCPAKLCAVRVLGKCQM